MARRRAKPRGGVPGPHRKAGAGSVFQVSPTRWRGAFTYRDPDTQLSRRVYVSATTEAGIHAAWAVKQRDLANGPLPGDAALTVRELLDEWLTRRVLRELRPTTYEAYLNQSKRIVSVLGDVRLTDLNRRMVQRMCDNAGETLAPKTVQLLRTTLHSALQWAVSRDLIEHNPADGVRLRGPGPSRQRALNAADLLHVLTYLEHCEDRQRALYLLIATTGLRRGEAIGLQWPDIDTTQRTLTVARQIVPTAGGLVEQSPKTESGQRTLPLMARTITWLRDHRLRMDAERTAAVKPWPDPEFLFVTRAGRRLNGGALSADWARLLHTAGLAPMRLHDLRHTLATLYQRVGGGTAREAQEQLGHSDVLVTLRTYTHIHADRQRDVIERLEGQLWPENGTVAPHVVPHSGGTG